MGSLSSTKPHIAMLPSPGLGHITPLFQLAKRLVTDHGLHISFLVVPSSSSTAQNELLYSPTVPSDLDVIELPIADMTNVITKETGHLSRICLMVREHVRTLQEVLNKLIDRPKAMIVDLFTTDAFKACENLSIPVYAFCTASANFLAFSLYLPVLDQKVEGEFIDLPKPIEVPGCTSVRTIDLVDQARDRKRDEYYWFLLHMKQFVKARGYLVNSWEDLEPVPLKSLRENRFYQEIRNGSVYPIGPLIKQVEPLTETENSIISWLDNQPTDSVLFVTFGSGGTVSSHQMIQLAQGLELSQQRFIMVARKPTDGDHITAFFNAGNVDQNDPETYLPPGFIKRTREVGLIVREWAPQVPVLGHRATGGFLSHCGWNSTLESLKNGVPIIAWPLYAEQRMNAASLAEEIGVAVKPNADEETGLVMKEEVERVVRFMLEGEEGKTMRNRAKKLQESANKGLEPGGSSYASISSLVKEISG